MADEGDLPLADRFLDAAHKVADGSIERIDQEVDADEVVRYALTSEGEHALVEAFERASNRPAVQHLIRDFFRRRVRNLKTESGDREDDIAMVKWLGGGGSLALFGAGVSTWVGASTAAAAASGGAALLGGVVIVGVAAWGWRTLRRRKRRRDPDIERLERVANSFEMR